MYRFQATKASHTFHFTAPSRDHESVHELRRIGYDVQAVYVLKDVCRHVKAFGGVYQAFMPEWVEV